MQCRYLINLDKNIPIIDTEVVVIGSGIAGLYTAHKLGQDHEIVLISKKEITESNTNYAQGGIAAPILCEDSPELHTKDTLYAGAGLCNVRAVEILTNEAKEVIEELIELGTQFDKIDGELALAQEGAHSCRRILRARGDATGAEIVRSLVEVVRSDDNVEILEHHYAVDIVTDRDQVQGVVVQKPDDSLVYYRAPVVVLATGGMGQIYRYTTNPDVATGDGVAMAYRAGASLANLEFYQFHPTVLSYPGAPRFLISEAVRGEGAILRNIHGDRFMLAKHEMAELAPRDVVSRAIVQEMEDTKATYVFLDITHHPAEEIIERFPTIYEECLRFGLDITHDWIPVAPAAHYAMGGVLTNEWGLTDVEGLYACGEVACTGLHGANRLASNSLTEGLVFGRRITQHANSYLEERPSADGELPLFLDRPKSTMAYIGERKLRLQKIMVRHVGVNREAARLEEAIEELQKFSSMGSFAYDKRSEFEFMNMLTCAKLIAAMALARPESRGAHHRIDYPELDPQWQHPVSISKERGLIIDAKYQ